MFRRRLVMVRILSLGPVRLALVLAVLVIPATVLAQHEEHMPATPAGIEGNLVLNAIEILTGIAAAAVAFQAALAYREGLLGKGMTWVAVGKIGRASCRERVGGAVGAV